MYFMPFLSPKKYKKALLVGLLALPVGYPPLPLSAKELSSNIRLACVGFENQTQADPDMPLRVMSYDGAEYRAQLAKAGSRYPVVTLVLYFG